jgi:hypothetical protein
MTAPGLSAWGQIKSTQAPPLSLSTILITETTQAVETYNKKLEDYAEIMFRTISEDQDFNAFADEQRAGAIVAWIAGIALGCVLVWIELVILWVLTNV